MIAILLFSLPKTGPKDPFLHQLIHENGKGAFYMNKIVRAGVRGWPPLLIRMVANYNYQQPLWKRLLAVRAWAESDTNKSWVHWKQFRSFIRDPDFRIRIAALDKIRYRHHRSRHFWTGLASASDDANLDVRKMASEVWSSNQLSEYPNKIWQVIERLLSDSSVEVRANVARGLRHLKLWPLEVWQKIPRLLNDKGTTAATLEALSQKKWPKEVWSVMPALLLREDLSSLEFDKLHDALVLQEQWTNEMIEAAKDYLRAHPKRTSSMINYHPKDFAILIEQRSKSVIDETALPSLVAGPCEILLKQKSDPLLFRMIDWLFDEAIGKRLTRLSQR